jgi:DDE_Tnp_1-associated
MQLFLTAFQSVPDPRAETVRHNLAELLIIALLAILCGARHCSEMAEFGHVKLKFLKRFLKLANGIPSHDTSDTSKFVRRRFLNPLLIRGKTAGGLAGVPPAEREAGLASGGA